MLDYGYSAGAFYKTANEIKLEKGKIKAKQSFAKAKAKRKKKR